LIGGLKEVCHLIGSCLDEIISSILAAEQLAEVDVSEGAAKKKQTRGTRSDKANTISNKLQPFIYCTTVYTYFNIIKVASVMNVLMNVSITFLTEGIPGQNQLIKIYICSCFRTNS